MSSKIIDTAIELMADYPEIAAQGRREQADIAARAVRAEADISAKARKEEAEIVAQARRAEAEIAAQTRKELIDITARVAQSVVEAQRQQAVIWPAAVVASAAILGISSCIFAKIITSHAGLVQALGLAPFISRCLWTWCGCWNR